MRISTLQSFSASVQAMSDQQAKLQHAEQQIATGLRVLKPSDDPGAAVRTINLENNLAAIGQFASNSVLAESQLTLEESALANINNSLQRLRELALQGANATNPQQTRQAIAAEVNSQLDELVALGNTRDGNGEYIFAGYASGAIPFIRDGNGNVSYAGDQGQRQLQVGEAAQVAVRDSGAAVFMRNPTGAGNIEALADNGNSGSLVVGQYGLTGAFAADNYTIDFTQAIPTDPITYTVSDGGSPPTVVSSGTYTENQDIQFAGVQISFSGLPADGDAVSVTPPRNTSVFATVSALAAALVQPTPDAASSAQLRNNLNKVLNDLDQHLAHTTELRTAVGSRLNIIDNQRNINEDFQVHLETALSDNRDLDYAEAISRFNLQLTALQAAQQAYVKAQGLSLFQYL